tara:strand:- start:354 stop:590 length:237 start_codon:yes stop_codon:yes gene_type:complete
MTTQIVNTEAGINDFQMKAYYLGIKALLDDMIISRGFTSTNCRSFVTNITGIKYKAGKKGLEAALMDLELLLTREKTA